jgi:hypothetical protein
LMSFMMIFGCDVGETPVVFLELFFVPDDVGCDGNVTCTNSGDLR